MLGDRVKNIRKDQKMTQPAFADRLSTSSGRISEVENNKKLPGTEFFVSLKREFNVDINWLLTGEGSPYIIGEENTPESSDTDPEVTDLLNMTRRIITSNTGYAHSLKANIRSFHDAVETQTRLDNLEQRLSDMEKDRSGNESGGCPPKTITAPDIKSDPGRRTGT